MVNCRKFKSINESRCRTRVILAPPASDASLLAPLSEVFHGVSRDRRDVVATLLQVESPRSECRLDSRRKACMVRFHITTKVRMIDLFKLHLSGAAPPELQLYHVRVRIGFDERFGVCCRIRVPRLRNCHTRSVLMPKRVGSWNFILLYVLVSCACKAPVKRIRNSVESIGSIP